MTQVYLAASNTWKPIISYNANFILAKDADGVMVYVIRNGEEQVK